MKPLSGLDGTFLHLETDQTPMHVGSLHLFDLPAGYRGDFRADMLAQIRDRLHLTPAFRRRLAPMPLQFANPVWVEDGQPDLEHHVTGIRLPRPGSMAQLEDCVGRLHGELLDRARPLWRLYVIRGLKSGQAAYYIKVHHAVLDGKAGVMLAQLLFDVSPTPAPVPPPGARKPRALPGRAALAAAALRHDAGQYVTLLRKLPELARTVTGLLRKPADKLGSNFAFGPRTPVNVSITGERGFAGLSLPIERIKAIGHAHQASLNDVVLALCAGAMRRYLARHGGLPAKPLIATMPISLREAGNTESTTQATLSLVNLNTRIADPVKRLHAIRDAAAAVKDLASRAKGIVPTDFPSITLPWVMHGLAKLYGRARLGSLMPPIANLVISNVPGPRVPLYAAGARMVSYWPLSIVEHGLGLNVTVMSYADTLGFGVTVARNAVPDAHEITQALQQAFDELSALTPIDEPVRKSPARKAAAKKPAAPEPSAGKPVARKTAARKPVARKPAARARREPA